MVGLADAIEALRQELIKATAAGDGQDLRFGLEPLELTLEVAVTTGGEAGIGWHVLKFGAKREFEHTQTLTLRLTPQIRRSDGSYSEKFLIAGTSPEGQVFPVPRP